MAEDKKIDVFISYHMDSSERLVDTISSSLEEAGINVWYAAKDIAGEFAGKIVDAINECRVFLIILNEHSALSGHCLNEFNIAFHKLNHQGDITIIPFKIAKFDLSKEAYYYLNRMRIFDGSLPPEVVRVRELIQRIKNVLGNKEQIVSFVNDEVLQTVKEYRLIGSDVNSDTQFVGRKKELEAIHNQMQVRNKIFLVGMGGIGKSELARTYAFLHKEDYDIVLWVSFQSSLMETFASDSSFLIGGLNRSDYSEETEETYFRRKLALLKTMGTDRVLLIVDNFDVEEDPHLDALCEIPCSILFTTRNRRKKTKYNQLVIEAMSDMEELLAIFKIEYFKDLEEEETEWVMKLLALLNGHPLSIRLVASAMQTNRIRPKQMYALLREGETAMMECSEDAAEEIYGRLKQVFRLSALPQEELYILKNLSLIPLTGVDVEMFANWCELDGFKTVDSLIRRSWIIHNSASDEIHLHPLVAKLMSEELEKDFSSCDKMIRGVIKQRRGTTNIKYKLKLKLLEIMESICLKITPNYDGYYDVRFETALGMFGLSRYHATMKELQELKKVTHEVENKLQIYSHMGHITYLSGFPQKAVEIILEGMAYAESLSPEEKTPRAVYYISGLGGRISEAYRGCAEYDLAEKYARKRLEEVEETFYQVSMSLEQEKGWAYYHLARILYMRQKEGDLEESEQMFKAAIDLFAQKKDRWSQAFCHDILSQIYMVRNDQKQAMTEIQTEYEILQPLLGDEHIDIAINYIMRANIYRYFGQETEALQYYQKACTILEKLGLHQKKLALQEIIDSGRIGYLP